MSEINNVSWGKPMIGGAVSVAPSNTALPENAFGKLNKAFKNLGYISDDGIANSNNQDSDKINAWGGDTVVVIQKGKDDTFKFKLIESINLDVLKTVYGEKNVTGSIETGITVKANTEPLPSRSYVIDMILKGDILKRIVIPNGSISVTGDIQYTDDDAIGFEITVEALPDKDGNTHYEYISKKVGD